MTYQVITVKPAYMLATSTRVFIQDVDTAIDFASWLQSHGFQVEMSEGPAVRCPPLEELAAAALTDMYARARA